MITTIIFLFKYPLLIIEAYDYVASFTLQTLSLGFKSLEKSSSVFYFSLSNFKGAGAVNMNFIALLLSEYYSEMHASVLYKMFNKITD